MSVIVTTEQLESTYGYPNEASTVKVADRITSAYRVLIDASPFAALATCGPEGLDCSPRGELPGFVRVHDAKTLMMPDRRGNNGVRKPQMRDKLCEGQHSLEFRVSFVAIPFLCKIFPC